IPPGLRETPPIGSTISLISTTSLTACHTRTTRHRNNYPPSPPGRYSHFDRIDIGTHIVVISRRSIHRNNAVNRPESPAIHVLITNQLIPVLKPIIPGGIGSIAPLAPVPRRTANIP